MDTSGSEITAKIRSAIKAKLLELGAYVDDELPDYIMVMIANKKTKEQMTEDLNLFLGKNSSIFTNWVHGVLDRLQAISQKAVSTSGVSSSAKEKPVPSNNVAESVGKKSQAPIKTSDSSPSIKRDKTKEKPTNSSAEKHPVATSKHDVKENKPKQQPQEKRLLKKSVNQDNVKSEEKYKIVEDDVLEMHADISGEEFAELSGKSTKEPISSKTKTNASVSTRRKPIEPPASSSSLSRKHDERSYKRSPSYEKDRKRRSVVAQVVQRDDYYNEDDDEEEYDPTRPQLGSVVRVSQRKYNVPKAMQPKPLIFMKALTAANASTMRRHKTNSPSRKRSLSPDVDDVKPPISSKRKNLHNRNRRSDDNEEAEFSDVEMVEDKVEYKVVAKKETVAVALTPPVVVQKASRDTRRVEYNEPPPPGTTDTAATSNEQSDEILVVDTTNPSPSSVNTRFVVTLDGVSSSFVKKVQLEEPTVSEEPSPAPTPVDSIQEMDDQDTLIVGVGDDMLDDQVLSTQQINEVKICLDDDEEEDEAEDHKRQSAVVVVDNSNSGSESGDKILERCKYYPSCKLGSGCQFIHPTTPCKMFPTCRFGDRCVFIHPNCRYDAYCTNKHCPYAHNAPRRMGTVVQAHTVPKTVIKPVVPPCKYGLRCSNRNCPFKHGGKNCLYGASCTRVDCTFSHPTIATRSLSPPSDANKFRWVATGNAKSQMDSTTVGGD